MHQAPWLFSICALCGCATHVANSPPADARVGLGATVRAALQAQVIDPDAGRKPGLDLGIGGRAGHEAMGLYEGTFKAPPPVTNVINIGGGVGSK